MSCALPNKHCLARSGNISSNAEGCSCRPDEAVLSDDRDDHEEEDNTSRMHHPPHPGETLREDILPALGLNVTQAAAELGVTRAALSRVLNGRAAISSEMALRLEGWLGVKQGGRVDVWVAQQVAYDLWQARKTGVPRIRRAVLIEA